MADDMELPDEVFGFGSWLLWLVATRATALVDRVYAAGPARPSRRFGMVDGHYVPTPALIAWLLTAAEFRLPAPGLAQRTRAMDERQKVLRTTVSRAINGEPRLFKDGWLQDLAVTCGFSRGELELLLSSRDDERYPVDHAALRTAIERTFRHRPSGYAMAATRTLPRDAAAFTGRQKQLHGLTTVADGAAMVGIYAISGMAGVGKTAFAVHAAHLLAPRFPDGQVFVSLHGHTPGQPPADPADALASLLLTAGVEAGQIPPGLEPRMRLWRDRLAGRRILLILDDATGHEHVRPLLPGTPGCLVLVTSRRRLTALEDAHVLSLDTLPPGEAAELLVRLAGRADLADGEVAGITRLCGHLPLAICLLARQLQHHPAWSAAQLGASLAAARDRLKLMTAESLSVAAAFELSYRDLDPASQRLFRRLSLHPGTDLDGWSAAALDDTDHDSACRGLNLLYDHCLLTEPAYGRYRCHDLIRQYATTLAAADPPGERAAAADRLLGFYLSAADAAGRYLARGQERILPGSPAAPGSRVPEFAGLTDAIGWLEAERLNLEAVVSQASAASRPQYAIALPAAISAFLASQGHWDQGIRLHRAALAAARRSGDQRAQARALRDLGALQRATADFPAAAASQREALALSRAQGDRSGEADALSQLGWLQYLADDYPAAAASLTTALGQYRDLGDPFGEADTLASLGYVRYVTDDYPAAMASLTRALELYQTGGDRSGEIGALNYLAVVQQQTGMYPAATASYSRALRLCQAIGDRNAEATLRTGLGYVRCMTGELISAAGHLIRALELHRGLGNRFGEASALNYLGLARRLQGDYLTAVTCQEQALEIYRAKGSRLGEANARQELGKAQQHAGDPEKALISQQRALDLYHAVGDHTGEAEALNNMGDLLLAASEPGRALASYHRAMAIIGATAVPLEQARALEGIGRCHLDDGRPADAGAPLRQALAIYRRLGSPGLDRVQEILRQPAQP